MSLPALASPRATEPLDPQVGGTMRAAMSRISARLARSMAKVGTTEER